MTEFGDIRFFVGIVEAGSLSAAARRLNASPPAMSRRLMALESRLGVRLIMRTSRRFEPTEEGRLFYERCVCILRDIEEAEAEASAKAQSPRGTLRVGTPMGLGRRLIGPMIGHFVEAYPELNVSLVLSDARLDVIEDDLDVALRVGLPVTRDVVVRKVLSERRVVCASPAYIARFGAPICPRDLLQHNCVGLVRRDGTLNSWRFKEDGNEFEIRVRGTLSTTSSEVLRDWVIGGMGIGLLALWDIEDALQEGALQECLHPYWCDSIDLFIVYANRRHLSARIRAFVDFITRQMPAR